MVTRSRRAGVVLVGQTATPEGGLAPTTASPLEGATRNPWDVGGSPGGSSGGSAVAVAAGDVPAATAREGGGALRMPAAGCGLFGRKPTRARTPPGPAHGIAWAG